MSTETVTTQATSVLADVPAAFTAATARRLATVERLAYGVAGIAATIGPQIGNPWMNGGAILLGAGALARLWARTRSEDTDRLLVTTYRSLPALGLSGVYVAALVTPGSSWWEYVAPGVVAVASAVAAPLTRSRAVRRAAANLPAIVQAADPQQAEQEAPSGDPYIDGLRRLWADSAMTGETRLTEVQQYNPSRPDFEAVIVAPAGEAVPYTLAQKRALAAVFDVPEGAITLAGVAGRGPGFLAVRVAPSYAAAQAVEVEAGEPVSLEDLWGRYVSANGGAAPGVELVRHRVEENRITLWMAAPRGRALRFDHDALCSALGIDDPSRLIVEGQGPREALAYVYPTNPLIRVRKPTAEDLTMDDEGRVAIGVSHDGTPAKIMLYNPHTGRAQNGITAGTTGAGKSGLMRLLGAAHRRSGVVSWMADVQGGMSMPEMDGRVDWFARGEVETMVQLRCLHRVKVYRETHSNGRGDFDINGPWRLIQWGGDEINRLLSSPDAERRKEASWMISDLQRTGHKVGIGVDLGVQSLHLKELGDNPEIREKGKEGHVFLMRTASSSTQAMGLDGIVPPDAHISPIPERIYETTGAEAKFDGTASTSGEPTPGMAWLIAEGRAVLMRTFTLDKVDGRFPQIEELMDGTPLPTLTPGEAAAAGPEYAGRNACATRSDINAAGALGEALEQAGVDPASTEYLAKPADVAALTLRERVLEVLADAPDGLPLKEIRTRIGCNTEGGPASGSVNNTVTTLAADGLLVACGRGVYRLA